MKKCLLLIVILILSSLCVTADSVVLEQVRKYNAGDFEIVIEPILNEITNIESASFKVTIDSKIDTLDYIGIFFNEVDEWKWVRTDPIYYGTTETTLSPLEKINFVVVMEPKEDIESGSHIIKTTFKSRKTGKSVDVPFDVYIKSNKFAKYAPDVKATIDMENNIDPRKDHVITVNIENYNARFYESEDIHIVLESELLGETEAYSGLAAREGEIVPTTSVKFPFVLDEKQGPQKDRVTGFLKIDDQLITLESFDFEVVDYTDQFKETIDTKSGFLKSQKTLVYSNEGNSPKKELIQVPTGFFSRFFTSTNPAAKVSKDVDGVRYLEWDVKLAPNEMFTVYISTNYQWLFFLLLIAIFLILYNYASQSPVFVEKEAYNIETSEGGISEMKVNVIVKNTSTRPLEGIEVIDKVPNIVDVLKEFDVGTLSPTKIVKNEGSTLIKWDIAELDPHEERILSYKIKSKLSILGDFSLPVANVKYKKGRKKVIVYSNNVVVQG